MLENKLFKFEEGVVSRWASHENPDGAKGAGGTVRNGRKGAPWFTPESRGEPGFSSC